MVRCKPFHLAGFDPRCHALHDSGLAHARIAHEQRVVLAPPSQDMERPLDLLVTANQSINLAPARPLVEIHGVGRQGIPGGAG